MESQYIPAYLAKDAKGDTYACIAPRQSPARLDRDAPRIHCITAYNNNVLWHRVKAWFDGGSAISGRIDPKAGAVQTFKRKTERPGRYRARQAGAAGP